MKTIKITADDKISVVNVDFDDYRSIQQAIGCDLFEPVKTQILFDFFGQPVMMLVDESGLIKDLRPNSVASYLYGFFGHGQVIVGDIIFAKPMGEDIVAPDNIEEMKEKLMQRFGYILKEKEKHE